jgi:hypothetical protein
MSDDPPVLGRLTGAEAEAQLRQFLRWRDERQQTRRARLGANEILCIAATVLLVGAALASVAETVRRARDGQRRIGQAPIVQPTRQPEVVTIAGPSRRSEEPPKTPPATDPPGVGSAPAPPELPARPPRPLATARPLDVAVPRVTRPVETSPLPVHATTVRPAERKAAPSASRVAPRPAQSSTPSSVASRGARRSATAATHAQPSRMDRVKRLVGYVPEVWLTRRAAAWVRSQPPPNGFRIDSDVQQTR